MRGLKLFFMFAVLALVAGCYTLSVHPLYTEADIVFDTRLIGVWGAPDESNETWTFEKSGGDAYRLVLRNEGIEELEGEKYQLVTEIDPVKDGIFEIHLVKLGEYLFFDVYPEEPEIGNEYFKAHVIPAHSFARVKIAEDSFSLAFFDTQWLENGIKEGRIFIDHTKRDDMVVLTANTADLQKFILKNIDVAFEDFETVPRLNPGN
jgi:hypothetical protein